ncbi:hypothetical protein EVAR_19427_1 [Eumeta japonica]|uniref:Uncharacterized protein n=1 Tax=Eumeta variegata TaxID=151549 RepID=A0A4C1TRP0_EUMVA|nr:hypothetical protein EVAR_19427_1 [Eumeta japonica]
MTRQNRYEGQTQVALYLEAILTDAQCLKIRQFARSRRSTSSGRWPRDVTDMNIHTGPGEASPRAHLPNNTE